MTEEQKEQKKHPHGPLKRTGEQASEWDEIIGPSLDAIPATQLPLKRTVLQRYRGLRIDNPGESTFNLAKQISYEVETVWNRARIPMTAHKHVITKVTEAINIWKKCHNPGELRKEKNHQALNSLLDLKPMLRGKISGEDQLQNLRTVMRQNRELKRLKPGAEQYDWEVDYNFYLDQFQVGSLLEYENIYHSKA